MITESELKAYAVDIPNDIQELMKAALPIKDGQLIEMGRGTEKVMGEISPPHTEPICWTLQGNWYRRSDGEQMTGWNGEVMTVKEFYRRRRTGEIRS